jgi:hypothetical protein
LITLQYDGYELRRVFQPVKRLGFGDQPVYLLGNIGHRGVGKSKEGSKSWRDGGEKAKGSGKARLEHMREKGGKKP